MAIVHTEYYLRSQRYTTSLFVVRGESVPAILYQRCLGETIIAGPTFVPPFLPSDLIAQFRFAEAFHAACWMAMIGQRAGTLSCDHFFDDDGFFHALSHLVIQDPEVFESLTDKLRYMILLAYWHAIRNERLVPGFVRDVDDAVDMTESRASEHMVTISQSIRSAMPDWWNANDPG